MSGNENRIRVRVNSEMTPTRLEDKMDLNAEIKVDVDSHLKGLAVAGIAALALATIALVAGTIMFAVGYPNPWYAAPNDAHYEASRALIQRVILTLGSGVILLFCGTSAFFYGRTVLGSGHLDQFSTKAVEVES